MTKPAENLLDWLRDAHAMEQQAEKMLKAQAERLEHYPDLRERITQHITETEGQQRKLVECIERLGKLRTSRSSGENGQLRDAEKPDFQSLIIG